MPNKVLNRKDKMGFPVPLKEWSEGPAKNFIEDIIFSRESKQRGLFNIDVLKNIIKEEGRYSREMWGVLNLELWFQQFKVEL